MISYFIIVDFDKYIIFNTIQAYMVTKLFYSANFYL